MASFRDWAFWVVMCKFACTYDELLKVMVIEYIAMLLQKWQARRPTIAHGATPKVRVMLPLFATCRQLQFHPCRYRL